MSKTTEKKRVTYNPVAVDKYKKKAYDRLEISVRKGRKAAIKAIADNRGESLNGFVVAAIDERVERLSSDDAYCKKLYDEYKADSDKGEPVSIESFAQGLGVSL